MAQVVRDVGAREHEDALAVPRREVAADRDVAGGEWNVSPAFPLVDVPLVLLSSAAIVAAVTLVRRRLSALA